MPCKNCGCEPQGPTCRNCGLPAPTEGRPVPLVRAETQPMTELGQDPKPKMTQQEEDDCLKVSRKH